MSKMMGAMLTCPNCGKNHETQLYRSLWIEDQKNRELLFNDKINMLDCPFCGHRERLKFSLFCTNKDLKFAVWYEPEPDAAVDKDAADYAKHFGPDSYFARAPRVRDWDDFKITIINLEEDKLSLNNMKNAFNEFTRTYLKIA